MGRYRDTDTSCCGSSKSFPGPIDLHCSQAKDGSFNCHLYSAGTDGDPRGEILGGNQLSGLPDEEEKRY